MKHKTKSKPKLKLPLETVRLRNFKALRDSGVVTFTPLTVLIGNNGSGKCSLIEGLETFQNIVLHGLDEAFLPWRGFEHVWNKAVPHGKKEDQIGNMERQNAMAFEIEGGWNNSPYRGIVEIATDLNDGVKTLTIEVTSDGIKIGNSTIERGLWEISLFQNPAAAP